MRARSTISWLDLRSALSSCCSGLISWRQPDVEACGLAGADGGQALLHLGERQQAEADLEQGDGEEADAGQRQRQREPRAEVAQARLDLAQRAGDGHRVALRRLALAEHVDGLGDAQPLLQRALEVGPADLALVGLDVVLARQRHGRAGERARLRIWRPGLPSSGLICQYQPEWVTSNSGSPTSLGVAGLLLAVIDGVGQDDGEQHARGGGRSWSSPPGGRANR